MRLYPECFPVIENEATTDTVEIIHTESHGEGLISKKSYKAGDLVFQFSGVALPKQNLHTLQFQKNLFIYDPYVMGKVLHSCDPNMFCSMYERAFYAIKDIAVGEYLTMDYEQTEDELYRKFDCQCGSDNCRGSIYGRASGGRRWKQD